MQDRRVVRTAGCLLITALSAVLYGCCFPPVHWQALAWIAQVPFFIVVRRTHLGVALLSAWVFTVTVAYTTGDWFPRAVANYYLQPQIVGLSFFFGVSTIMAAPYVMAFAFCYRRAASLPAVIVPLVAAAAWVAHEVVRVRALTGNPWAVFGYSQVGLTPLLQIADATGIYGVSFLLVGVNAAVAEICLGDLRRRRGAVGGLAVAVLLVTMTLAYGQFRLRTQTGRIVSNPEVPVAIAQGNLDFHSQWQSKFYGRNLDVYLRLTQAALADGPPALVFWPESAMTFFLDQQPTYRAAISYVLQPSGAQLIAGGPRALGSDVPRYYNSTFLIAPTGQILAYYDKQQLLPFAEYFPFRSLDFLRRRFERVREFSPGADTPPLPTSAGRAGIIVCNEAMFAAPAAARVAAGAEYLVNPSNDSWLGDPKFSAQQLDIVSVRAIEQRRYLVRTSTAGPSAIVDPFGRVLVHSEPFSEARIRGTIRPCSIRTPYLRVGDLFAFGCVVLTVAATAWGRLRGRQRSQLAQPSPLR